MTKANQLRTALKSEKLVRVMGAHHALGAKLIEASGFDAIWASGFEIATAHGVPDANILTMTENLEVAVQINTATKLPVICDCDTGYGNALNVMHMVRKYEAAGIAAVVIEDKLFPKVNSFIPGRQELASVEEFSAKIEAAKSARSQNENGILVIARVEALIAGWGMDEAVKRATAYAAAGADGIVIHSKAKTPEEIFTFSKLWEAGDFAHVPLVSIPTTYHSVKGVDLRAHGFSIVIYANQGLRASVGAMKETFRRIIEDDTTTEIESEISTMNELFHLQGMPAYREEQERFAGEREKIAAVIPAAANHQFQPELSAVLRDQPLCMLQVGGKPLLEHQLDILRSAGIRETRIVAGYKKEKVESPGTTKIINENYEKTSSAYSVMLGLEGLEQKTLVCYSDIIFDRQIPESLLRSPSPVTIVIDRSYKTLPRRDKELDIAVADEDKDDQRAFRKLRVERFKKIKSIGKRISPGAASYEFIGMMLFTKEGLEQTKKAWADACGAYRGKPFYEAKDIEHASMTDLFQYMIDSGLEVRGMVIEHGWSEVFSLEDYERLDNYFCEKNKSELSYST